MIFLGSSTVLLVISAFSTVGFLGELNRVLFANPKHPEAEDLLTATLYLVVASFSGYSSQRLLSRTTSDFTHDMRITVTNLVANASLERLDQVGTGKIMTVLLDDIDYFISLLRSVPVILYSIFIVSGCVGYLLYLDLLVGLAMVVGIPILLFAGRKATMNATRVLLLGRKEDELIRSQVTRLVDGAKEVKLNHIRRENLVDRDLTATSGRATNRYIHSMHLYRSFDEIVKVFYFGFIIATIAYGMSKPNFGLVGSGAVIILLIYMQGPIQAINFTWERILPAWLSLQKLRNLNRFLSSAQEMYTDKIEVPGWSEIRVANAYYRYPVSESGDQAFELGPIDITLKRGSVVYITGANGSGKTTFGKLISGLYYASRGSLLLDGKEILQTDMQNYRELFTILFADKYLFDEVIPSSDVSSDDVRELLMDTDMDSKVTFSDWRFSTLELSTGQRDRLALVDAITQRKPVIIFDEWAANQDPKFRNRFYNEILPNLKKGGHTLLVISHDDRYYHLADELWVMDNGTLKTTEIREGS